MHPKLHIQEGEIDIELCTLKKSESDVESVETGDVDGT